MDKGLRKKAEINQTTQEHGSRDEFKKTNIMQMRGFLAYRPIKNFLDRRQHIIGRYEERRDGKDSDNGIGRDGCNSGERFPAFVGKFQ